MALTRLTPLADLLTGVGQALADANTRLTRANAPALLSTATVELSFSAQTQARFDQLMLAGFRQAPQQLTALGRPLTNATLSVTAIAAPSLVPTPPGVGPASTAPGLAQPGSLGKGVTPPTVVPPTGTPAPPLGTTIAPLPPTAMGGTGPTTPPPGE